MAKAATSTAPPKPNIISQTKSFALDVRTEMEKVTWPTTGDLKAMTTVTLIFLGILAVIVGVMDVIFQNSVLWLLRIF